MKSKRILSVLLAIVMLSTVLPTVAFAESSSGTATGGLITGASDFDTVLGAGNYEYSNNTIKILKDLTFYNPLMFELSNTYFTLDLNGKTLDMRGESVILYSGGLTIIDSGDGGTIQSSGDPVQAISYESDLNISGGTFTATGYGVAVKLDHCNSVISGGTFAGRYAIQRLNGTYDAISFKLAGSPVLNGFAADIYIENPSNLSSITYYGYEPADGNGPASIMMGNWPDSQYGRVVTNWDNDKTLSDYFVYAGNGSQNDPFIVEDPLYEHYVIAEKPYDAWIGTTRITRLNQDDVFGDGTVSFTSTSTNILVLNLNNFSYEGSAHSSTRGIIDIENYPYENYHSGYHVSANITGTNTIVAKNTPAYGIVSDSNFSLNGDGSLNISGCKYGMYITDANNWHLTKEANSVIPTLEITSTVAASNKSMYLFPNEKEYKLTLGEQAPVRHAGGKNIATENVTYFKVEEAPLKPVISIVTQPAANTNVTEGNISGTLTVAGSVENGSSTSLNYQWYSSTVNANFNGTLIDGATGSSFTIPENLAPGTYYYYCTLSMDDANTVRSSVATVVVEAEVIIPTHTHNCGHDECDGAWENFVVIDSNFGATTNPRLTNGNTYYYVLGDNMSRIGFNPSIGSGTATMYLCLNGHSVNDITIPAGVTMYICDCANAPGIVSARFNVYGTAMIGSGRYPLLRQMANTADVHVYGPITMGDYVDFSTAGDKTITLDNEDAKIHFSTRPYAAIKFIPYGPGVFATGWEPSFNSNYMPVSANDAYEVVYNSATGELSFVEKAATPTSYNITKAATENGSFNVPATAIEDEEVTIVATPDTGYELDSITVTGNSGNVTVTDGKFTMPGEDVTVRVTFKVVPHTHCVCGTTHTNIGNHTTEENPTWVAISRAEDFTKNKENGYYYLTDDIEVSAKWEFTQSRDIVLCLNGHDITYTGSSNVSFIPGSTALNLTLTDCQAEAGSISGFKNTYGGAINVKKTFTMYNGKITGNTASQGGGVYVDQSATFYMYGGEITGNTASSLGGGVYIKGSMEVAGAPIVNNNINSNTGTSYQNKMSAFTKNIYSSNDAVVVGTGGLTAGAKLDVTPKFPVSESTTPDAVVTIAKGCTSDLSSYFTYTSKHEYTMQYDEAKGEVQLKYIAPPAPKVVVTFDMNGHGEQISPQTIDKGTCATRPENPTADGYLFLGWEDDYGSWDFGWEIWFNTTLYAKWIEKPAQSAPETPVAVSETIKGKNDGKITGVTDAMEYKKQGDADYIAITGTEIADLAAGTYLVRYKETDRYLASPDKQLVIADGAWITVSFASNGGSAVESKTCEYNQTITAPDAPTKEGFEFIAWYADDTLTTKWNFETPVAEDKTLYAKWVQGVVSDHEDHVDEIEAEGLNDIAKAEETDIKLVVQTEPITEGDTEQTAIKDITDAPDHFNFYDITLEKSTGGYVTDASSVIEIKLPYDFLRKTNIKVYRYHNGMPEELAQLEARATTPYVDGKCFIDATNNCIYIYSAKFSTYAVAYDTVQSSSGSGVTRYTVKFDTDGGSKIANKTVTRNSKIAEPTVPKKEGYKFDGWYKDKEFTTAYDFTAKVTKSFTLYAKWEKVNDEKEENPDTHNCPSKGFDDLDVNLWYHLSIDYVLEKELMKGIDEKTFAPDETLTRAMLVTVLYRMENEPSTNRSIPFSDVDMGAYYANAVSWAKQNGIVYGVTENEFAPDKAVTREQLAAILYRYSVFKGDLVSAYENTDISHYADANAVSSYAKTAMQYAVGSNLIRGTSEYTLSPQENTTRAEISAVLERVAGRLH